MYEKEFLIEYIEMKVNKDELQFKLFGSTSKSETKFILNTFKKNIMRYEFPLKEMPGIYGIIEEAERDGFTYIEWKRNKKITQLLN